MSDVDDYGQPLEPLADWERDMLRHEAEEDDARERLQLCPDCDWVPVRFRGVLCGMVAALRCEEHRHLARALVAPEAPTS